MHLEEHAGGQPLALDRLRDADHGPLDDVGGGALKRRVYRGALAAAATRRVLVADIGRLALAPETRRDDAVLALHTLGATHIISDSGLAFHIAAILREELTGI